MTKPTVDYTQKVLSVFKNASVKDSSEDTDALEINLELVFEGELKLDYEAIQNLISLPDYCSINMLQKDYDNLALFDNKDYNNLNDFKSDVGFLYDNVNTSITYKIVKNKAKAVKVYDKFLFDKWVNSKNCLEILKKIRKHITEFEGLSLNIDETETSLVEKPSDNDSINESIIQNCRFMDFKDFPFNAFWFQKILNTEIDLAFCKKLKEVFFIFLLAGIFDSTDFKEESATYRLTGNKSFQAELRFDSINTSSIQTYWQIYEWI